ARPRRETLHPVHPERVLRLERVEVLKGLRGIRRPRVQPDHGGEKRWLATAEIVRPVAVRNVPHRYDQVSKVVEHTLHEIGAAAGSGTSGRRRCRAGASERATARECAAPWSATCPTGSLRRPAGAARNAVPRIGAG